MHILNGLEVTADKQQVLETLYRNKSIHSKIVKEAREGYVKKAMEAVKAKMDQLASGKLVALHFTLEVPQDHTKVYNTAIKALEMHTGKEIELDALQVRNLLMNEWDWMDHFLLSNQVYSGTAREVVRSRDE